jgi:hypothetical protein
MKKIAFDLIGAEVGRYGVINHGGGEYVKTICSYFCNHNDGSDIYCIISGKDNNMIEFLKQFNVKIQKCCDFKTFQNVLNTELFDVLYCGLVHKYYTNISVPKFTQLIITIHGLRPLELIDKYDNYCIKIERKKYKNIIKKFLAKFSNSFYKRKVLNTFRKLLNITPNEKIFTVSNHSKFAIQYYYPECKNVYVGYSPMKISNPTQNEPKILEEYGLKSHKYILLNGGNRWEKNCLRAIEALDDLYCKNLIDKDVKVVITGVTYDKPFIKYKNIPLVMLKYVPTQVLETLYQFAHLFVYPTINEGFGYPPLEAMKYHTLVACSAICSIPEVCGDSVMYFNPYDQAEIKNRVLQSFDCVIREYYISKIDERLNYINSKQEEGLIFITKVLQS